MASVIRSLRALAFPLSFGTSNARAEAEGPEIFEVADPVLDIRVGDTLRRKAWTLSAEADPAVYTVDVPRNGSRRICFESDGRAICRTVGIGDAADFVIRYLGRDYPQRIVGAHVPPAATFDAAYRRVHRGKITMLVPEIYELVSVAIALTPYAREHPALIMKDTPYLAELQRHFAPVSDHPFVTWLDAEMRKDGLLHSRHRMNGHAFEYDARDRIVRSRIYDRTSFPNDSTNSLLPMLAQMQSFSDMGKFRAFYSAHRALYADRIAFVRDGLAVDEMLAWLHREFPAVQPYDHVKVIFSPLVCGSQSVTWFTDGDFKEIQPHVNFPHSQTFDTAVSEEARTLQRGNLLFTAISRGFIDPTGDRFADAIDEALAERSDWVGPDDTTPSRPGGLTVFDEMMAWGLVDLYRLDKAPPADLETLLAENRRVMTQGRGFKRFPEFGCFLVDLYRNRPQGTTIADLYPQIICWFAEHPKPEPVPS